MNSVHQETKNFAGSSSLADPFDQNVNHAVDQAALLDKRERTGDQNGHDAVGPGPKRLGDLLDVLTVQLSRLDAAPHRTAQTLETTLASLRLLLARDLLGLYERNDIVIGIIHAKLYIGAQAALQAIQRIGRIGINGVHLLLE